MSAEKRAHCDTCDEDVKPVEKDELLGLVALPMLLALASVAASLLAAIHTFSDDTVHGPAIAVLWPVAIAHGWSHPKLLAVVVAFLAFLAVAWVSVKLNEHIERNARCPQCGTLVRNTPVPRG